MPDHEEATASDPLLGRIDEQDRAAATRKRRRKVILATFASAVVLLSAFTVAGILFTKKASNNGGKPNVILMISDGFGPASETLARNYYQYTHDVPAGTQLPLDTILVGASRTRSSDSFVTDSAAGATAFACGIKTLNGAIAVSPGLKPCGTVLEAAKEQGYLTGMVVTSRITHATPACFASHANNRVLEDDIALHEIGNYTLGRRVDLMFGGGSCFFKPNSEAGSCRSDDIDAYAMAKDIGWHVASDDRTLFDALDPASVSLPLLNLFSGDHMAYEIDRDEKSEPSLKEMALKALDILTLSEKKSKGFFLMIEGSRIDMAAHNNDPATHVREILAYQQTIEAVKKFVDENPGTIMISVSDHETGGLSVGRQLDPNQYPVYNWNPDALTRVQRSTESIAPLLIAHDQRTLRKYITQTVFPTWLDIHNATSAEIDSVVDLATATDSDRQIERLSALLGELSSRRAGLGWATQGHSAVDVNLYAYGHNADQLRGNHENTEIGDFIIRHMGLDVGAITTKLTRDPPNDLAALKAPSTRRGDFQVKHYHSHSK
ncbi:alkaline phosphatase [Powellomyces hirtus]|nr:alkaline phosphatase [Powellomyces hirtus]